MHDPDPADTAAPPPQSAAPPSAATGCRRFAAVACLILFATTAAASLLPFEVARKLLVPQTWLRALDRARFPERLPAVLAEKIVRDEQPLDAAAQESDGRDRTERDAQGAPAESNIARLDVADWEAIVSYLFPPDEVRTQAERVVLQLFEHLEYRDADDTPSILLRDVQRRLADPACVDLALRILESKPPCTPEDLRRMRAAGDEVDLPVCRPPPEHAALFRQRLEQELAEAAQRLPETLDLDRPLDLESVIPVEPGTEPTDRHAAGHAPRAPRTEYRQIKAALLAGPLVSLPWLALVVACGVRSRRDAHRWIGAACLTAGLFGFAAAGGAAALVLWGWMLWVEPNVATELGTGIARLASDVARAVSGSYVTGLVVDAAVLTGIGAALLFTAPRPVEPILRSEA